MGRGLDSLFTPAAPSTGVREITTASIQQNPRQPRTYFDEQALEELAASIREHGIIQPLIVSKRDEDTFELIAGERRWRAAQRAGLERVPVIVRETTPQQLLELALIENVQRSDLNALEEAYAYQALKDDFGLSDEAIAQRLGKQSREAVANTRRLLQLAPEAQQALLKGAMSAGHGRALLKLKDAEQQSRALQMIAEHELSVREVERLSDLVKANGDNLDLALAALREQRAVNGSARKPAPKAAAPASQSREQSPEDLDVKREMERVLGTPVQLSRTEKDLRVTIVFHTDEKLQEFFDMLRSAS
jgi:ParB family chromosome partitioning protein